MITFPNAKINLGLQVLRKRPDNYHDLETVFYPIPLYDALEIVEATETKLFVSGLAIPSGGDNLCNQVYEQLKKDYSIPPIHIYLHKNIPIGAGLGGGSSDAAFLIKLINDYFQLKLDSEQMTDYARKLGADCAFFIENRPVFAAGKGDCFSKLQLDLSNYYMVLVKPDIHISTAEVFNGFISDRNKSLQNPTKVNDWGANENSRDLANCILQPIETWKEFIFNDFETVVFKNHPQIEEIKQCLYQHNAIYAAMSGTGSSVFGIFGKPIRIPELEKLNRVLYCNL